MIACFAAPSFHDGSEPPDVAVWAGAGNRGPERAASNAMPESMVRRLIPAKGAVVFMIGRSVQIRMTRLIAGGRISKLLHGLLNREAAGLLARRELLEAYEML